MQNRIRAYDLALAQDIRKTLEAEIDKAKKELLLATDLFASTEWMQSTMGPAAVKLQKLRVLYKHINSYLFLKSAKEDQDHTILYASIYQAIIACAVHLVPNNKTASPSDRTLNATLRQLANRVFTPLDYLLYTPDIEAPKHHASTLPVHSTAQTIVLLLEYLPPNEIMSAFLKKTVASGRLHNAFLREGGYQDDYRDSTREFPDLSNAVIRKVMSLASPEEALELYKIMFELQDTPVVESISRILTRQNRQMRVFSVERLLEYAPYPVLLELYNNKNMLIQQMRKSHTNPPTIDQLKDLASFKKRMKEVEHEAILHFGKVGPLDETLTLLHQAVQRSLDNRLTKKKDAEIQNETRFNLMMFHYDRYRMGDYESEAAAITLLDKAKQLASEVNVSHLNNVSSEELMGAFDLAFLSVPDKEDNSNKWDRALSLLHAAVLKSYDQNAILLLHQLMESKKDMAQEKGLEGETWVWTQAHENAYAAKLNVTPEVIPVSPEIAAAPAETADNSSPAAALSSSSSTLFHPKDAAADPSATPIARPKPGTTP